VEEAITTNLNLGRVNNIRKKIMEVVAEVKAVEVAETIIEIITSKEAVVEGALKAERTTLSINKSRSHQICHKVQPLKSLTRIWKRRFPKTLPLMSMNLRKNPTPFFHQISSKFSTSCKRTMGEMVPTFSIHS
jgi:hypothetical protein